MLYQITTPNYCAGIVVEDGVVIEAAPIVKWAVGRKIDWLINYFEPGLLQEVLEGEKTMAQMDVGSKKTEGKSISDKLTERLELHGSRDMQQKVEDLRYSKIIDQRADLMSKAIDIIDKMEADLRKLEKAPDSVIRDLEGKVLSSGFTDKKFEEIKKLKEKIEKAHKAFDKALNGKEQKDFDDVKQLVANQPTDKKPEKPEGEGGVKDKGES